MNELKEHLLKFRDLKISRSELFKVIQSGLSVDEPILISNIHLIKLLESYKSNIIDDSYLLDWVNTVWFSDWFYYSDEECDCIACILNELEEIDEEGHELNTEKVEKYIFALENNLQL